MARVQEFFKLRTSGFDNNHSFYSNTKSSASGDLVCVFLPSIIILQYNTKLKSVKQLMHDEIFLQTNVHSNSPPCLARGFDIGSNTVDPLLSLVDPPLEAPLDKSYSLSPGAQESQLLVTPPLLPTLAC